MRLEVQIGKNKKMFKGIANLGYRPTFRGKKILLEVNIFNFSKNIYFRKLKVDFIRFIRGERKFKNINALKKQIDKDILVSKKNLNKLNEQRSNKFTKNSVFYESEFACKGTKFS